MEEVAEHQQHFGIRKLTVGAASVLLGTTLWLGTNSSNVHADTGNDKDNKAVDETHSTTVNTVNSSKATKAVIEVEQPKENNSKASESVQTQSNADVNAESAAKLESAKAEVQSQSQSQEKNAAQSSAAGIQTDSSAQKAVESKSSNTLKSSATANSGINEYEVKSNAESALQIQKQKAAKVAENIQKSAGTDATSQHSEKQINPNKSEESKNLEKSAENTVTAPNITPSSEANTNQTENINSSANNVDNSVIKGAEAAKRDAENEVDLASTGLSGQTAKAKLAANELSMLKTSLFALTNDKDNKVDLSKYSAQQLSQMLSTSLVQTTSGSNGNKNDADGITSTGDPTFTYTTSSDAPKVDAGEIAINSAKTDQGTVLTLSVSGDNNEHMYWYKDGTKQDEITTPLGGYQNLTFNENGFNVSASVSSADAGNGYVLYKYHITGTVQDGNTTKPVDVYSGNIFGPGTQLTALYRPGNDPELKKHKWGTITVNAPEKTKQTIYYVDADTGELLTTRTSQDAVVGSNYDISNQTIKIDGYTAVDPSNYSKYENKLDGKHVKDLDTGQKLEITDLMENPLQGTVSDWHTGKKSVSLLAAGRNAFVTAEFTQTQDNGTGTVYGGRLTPGWSSTSPFPQPGGFNGSTEIARGQDVTGYTGSYSVVYPNQSIAGYKNFVVLYTKNTPTTTTETATVTRTINYRGHEEGSTNYTPVNGSPDNTSTYTQTVNVTRTVTRDGSGNITNTTAWTPTDASVLNPVQSKAPSSVGYDTVDTPEVAGITIPSNIVAGQTTALPTVTVTYTKNNTPEAPKYVQGKKETAVVTRTINYWDKVTGERIPADLISTNPTTDTITFTRTPVLQDDKVIGYGTVNADGSSWRPTSGADSNGWTTSDGFADGQFAAKRNPDLSSNNYTAPEDKDGNPYSAIPSKDVHAGDGPLVYNVYYGHQTQPVTDTKSVERNFHYIFTDGTSPESHTKDGLTIQPTQTVTFNGKATKDLVTGKTGDMVWTPSQGSLSKVPGSTVNGYHITGATNADSTTGTAPIVTVNPNSGNIDVTIVYTPDEKTPEVKQQAKVTIVDKTENNKELTHFNNNEGKAGEAISFDSEPTALQGYLDAGYVFDSAVQGTNGSSIGTSANNINFGTFDNIEGNVQDFTIYLIHGTDTKTETDTTTSTVHYVVSGDKPNKPATPPDNKQTINWTKTDTIDKVTNKVTPGEWTPTSGSYKDVPTPTLDGYTPDKDSVPAPTPKRGENPYNVVVYTPEPEPDKQKATLKIVDETNNQVLSTFTNPDGISGKAISFDGSDTTLNTFISRGYNFVKSQNDATKASVGTPGNFNYGNFDNDSNVDQAFTIYLNHKINDVVEKGTSSAHVHYIMGDGTKAPDDSPTQTINWTRTNKVDQVTGKVTPGEWTHTPDKFNDVTSPTVDGYTPDKPTATFTTPEVNKDQVVNVVYTKNPEKPVVDQTATFEIYDKTNNNKELNNYSATGKSGATISFQGSKPYIDSLLKLGYKIDSFVDDKGNTTKPTDSNLIFSNFDDNDNTTQDFKLYLVHDTEEKTETATSNAHVHYIISDGKVTPPADSPTQTITWTKTDTVDKVTGETTKEGTWTPDKQSFTDVKSPELAGYTPNKANVTFTTPERNKNQVVDVVYNPIPEEITYHYSDTPEEKTVTRTITYWDKTTGQKISADVIKAENGTQDLAQKATISRKVVLDNKGNIVGYGTISEDGKTFTSSDNTWTTGQWDAVTSPDLKGYGYGNPDKSSVEEVTVDSTTPDNQHVDVYYEHTYVTVTPNKPGDPNKPVNDKGTHNFPDGLTKTDLEKTVTRTINYVGVNSDGTTTAVNGSPDGKSSFTQNVNFTKHAIVDRVTGEIVGYDTNNDDKADTQDSSRAWMPNIGNFDNVKSQLPASVTDKDGKAFDTVDIPEVSSTSVLPDSTFLDITVTYRHTPKTPETSYNGTNETKDVTRTIEYKDIVTGQDIPSDLAQPQTQKVTLTRTRITDNKGNFIGYGTVSSDGKSYSIDQTNPDGWNTGSWSEVISPDLTADGYTAPDKAKVSEVTVTGATQDAHEVIYYGHQTIPVTPDKPKNPTDPVNPGQPHTPNYPKGVDEQSLNKTVTRTINYVDDQGNKVNGAPDGTSQEVETVKFSRTAIVDKVTGELLGYDTNGDGKADTNDGDRAWTPTTSSYKEVTSKTPGEVGYTSVDKPVVSGSTVVPTDKDSVVTVTYSNKLHNYTYDKNPETKTVTRTINYYDGKTNEKIPSELIKNNPVTQTVSFERTAVLEDGKIVGYGTISEDGHSFIAQDWHTKDGKNTSWASVVSPDLANAGYKAPRYKDNTAAPVVSEQGVTADTKDATVDIYYDHQTVPVDPTNPGTPDKPINPDDPRKPEDQSKYPKGTTKTDLEKTITRTIHYEGADQYTPDDVKQPVNFTAHGELDKVTGEWVTPLTWSDDQTFDAKNSPIIPGYHVESVDRDTTDNKNVDSATISHTGGDYTVIVKYSKDQAPTPETTTGKVTYIDDTENKTLKSDPLSGNIGANINYTTQDKIANYEKMGYKLVSNDFVDGKEIFNKDAAKNNFVVHLAHAIIPVNPENPGTPDKPINPNDPRTPDNQPKYPNGTTSQDLTKTITRTIHYVTENADGSDRIEIMDPVSNTAIFTGKGYLDKVTGKWTDANGKVLADQTKGITWSADQTLPGRKSQVVNGYYLSGVEDSKGNKNSVDSDDNINVKDVVVNPSTAQPYDVYVVYKPVGHIIPVDKETGKEIPGQDHPQFPNDPRDPTKITDGKVPYVPGYNPSDNKNPGDPVEPNTNPGEDVKVPYEKPVIPVVKDQIAQVIYRDLDNGSQPIEGTGSGDLTGKAGSQINYETSSTISSLEKKGYVLVNNGFDPSGQKQYFDNNDDTVQTYYVDLRHKTIPVNPDHPVDPNQPIDPSNPDNPTKPADGQPSMTKEDLTKTVTRTIHYVEKGNEINVLANPVTETVTFIRHGVIDTVTGKLVNLNADGTIKDENGKLSDWTYTTSTGQKGTADKYTFAQTGDKEIINKDGAQYNYDSVSDDQAAGRGAVKAWDATTDSKNQDVTVYYTKQTTPDVKKGSVIVVFHDDTSKVTIPGYGTNTGEQEAGSTVSYKSQPDIDTLTKKGYVYVPTPGDQVPTTIEEGTKTITIHMKHGTTPVNPENPGKPGEPINPNDPTGPKYPSDTDKDSLTKTVTRDFEYKFTDGTTHDISEAPQTVTFTAQGVLDKVTGQWITPLTWNKTSDTLASVAKKEVAGYHVVSTSNANLDGSVDQLSVNPQSGNVHVVVTYAPDEQAGQTVVGKQIVHYVDGEGNKLLEDNTNSTFVFEKTAGTTGKEGTWNESSHKYSDAKAPVITGYVAEKATYEGQTGTPTDPDKEITIVYHKIGKIIPVDPDHKPIPGAETPEYKNDPSDPTKVIPNEPIPNVPGWNPVDPTQTVTPKDPTKDTEVPYTKPTPTPDKGSITVVVHDRTTNTDLPSYGKTTGNVDVNTKFDFNKPGTITELENKGYKVINPDVVIPGEVTKGDQTITIYVEHQTVPVNPENPGKPGEPINPNDPTGPNYPSDTDKDSLTKTGTQTVHYVGAGDATPKDNVTTVTFEHHLVIDKVTGKVVKDEGWTPDSETYDKINTPIIDGYTADKSVVGGDSVKSTDGNINREYTVTYTPKTTPVTPVTPDIPTPETQPTVTTIDGKQTITFVDGDNNNAPLRDADVQTHKFTITNGVPSENSFTFGTVNVPVIAGYVAEVKTAGGKTVTPDNPEANVVVVYHKIGKIVPVDPDHNPIPGADTPEYKNDPNDPTKVVPNENVPIIDGYTPEVNTVTPEDPTKDTEVVYTKKTTTVTPDEPVTPKKHKSNNKPKSSKPTTPKPSSYNYNNAPHAQNGYWNNNVAPHGQGVNGWSNNIGPHGEHVDANGNIIAPNGQIIGYVDKNGNPHYTKSAQALPQTGQSKVDTAATLLGGAAASLSLIGLAGVKKRRKKD